MIPNELYAKILPRDKLNTLVDLGAGIFIDAIFCDGANTKIHQVLEKNISGIF